MAQCSANSNFFAPRLAPLIAAAFTVLAAFGFLEIWLGPERLAGVPLTTVLAHERDDHGYIAHQVANASPAKRRAVLVGGSSLREGLLAPKVLSRKLSAAADMNITAYNLSSFDQTMTESLGIVSNLRLGPSDVVFLGLGPRRFTHG